MWFRFRGMRGMALGAPGPLRQRLNSLVLAGTKTATAGAWKYDYRPHDEAIEVVGERQALLDDNDTAIAVVEIIRVEQVPFDGVSDEFIGAEGEGFRDVEHWRDAHRSYYSSQNLALADDDLMVCVWFKVVKNAMPT